MHPHHQTPHDHRDKARDMVSRTGNNLPHHKVRHGYASGGALSRDEDEREDEAEVAHGVHAHESHLHKGQPKTKLKSGGHVDGAKAQAHLGKRARGGHTGKKGTRVNVIVAPQGGGGAPPAPMMPPAMARPVAPPPAAMPPPRPPMAPPGAGIMPPGMGQKPPGMMKSGGGVQKTEDIGRPWEETMQSNRGGHVKRKEGGRTMKRDVGGMTPMPGQQAPTPQQIQQFQQMQAAQMGGAPAGVTMPTQKRGGRTERKNGGGVHMEAGALGGEGRIEKMHAYGVGGFKPKEHNGELVRARG